MGTEYLLSQLQQQIFLLMEDLREIIPAEKRGYIQIAERFFELKDKEYIMGHVVRKILPHKTQIEDRNEKFFLENKNIFGELPGEEVNYFGDLIMKGNIAETEKDKIWQYFEVFVVLAEEYKKVI